MPSVELKQRIKRCLARVWGLFGSRPSRGVSVVLNYHSVHPSHPFSTLPEDFQRQMGYLKSNFSVVSLAEFHELRTRNAALPAKTAVITFDDGFRDNYEYAYPVLRELGLPATIFLSTGFVSGEIDITAGWDDYCGLDHLDWSQVREMGRHGIHFGAHTHNHRILTEVPLDQAEQEIMQSKRVLEAELGKPARHFAFPLGQPGTFNPDIIRILKKHDFELACSTLWGTRNAGTDLFALHRVRIDSCDTMADFVAKLAGHWNFVGFFQKLRG